MDHDTLHSITVVLGFVAGALYITSHYMKTMVPLRICEIASNALFVIYGAMYPSWPTLALYGILVPLNSLRLYEMLQLVKKVRSASQGDLSMDWLKPFMHKHSYKQGDVLFRKGDHADEMFYIVSGTCRINEMGIDLHPGQLVGEMGFLTPEHERTATVECIDDVEMLTITYDKVSELYFQNPTFGFYFLKLTSERLLQNVKRLERELESRPKAATA
jgi:CRP/FNR family cyclic AMP-dependent transcriptional regulator